MINTRWDPGFGLETEKGKNSGSPLKICNLVNGVVAMLIPYF